MAKPKQTDPLHRIAKILNSIDISLRLILDKYDLRPEPGKHPRKHYSHKLIGAYRDAEFRNYVISLRKQGMCFRKMSESIKNKWPDDPNKHKSPSSLHRFIAGARMGKLREYGNDYF